MPENSTSNSSRARHPDGPQSLGFLRIISGLIRNPMQCLLDISRKYGDLILYRFGGRKLYALNHARHVSYVLDTNQSNFTRKEALTDLLPLIGNGLFSSDESYWIEQRQRTVPAFRQKYDGHIYSVVSKEVDELLTRWAELSTAGPALVAIEKEMKELLLKILVKAMLCEDTLFQPQKLIAALDTIQHSAGAMSQTIRLVKNYFMGLAGRKPGPPARVRAALKVLDDFVYSLIQVARYKGPPKPPLMRVLLQANASGEIDERQVRDEIMTFLFAGFDTVAEMLSWTFYLLARNPEAERRLHGECFSVCKDRVPLLTDLEKLPYCKAVLPESLRLYPPAWAFYRVTKEDDNIGGHHVEGASRVAVCPFTLHRDPAAWDQAENFLPERFLQNDMLQKHSDGWYIPFGYGRHICVGRRLALLEGQLILVMICQRYRLELASKRPVKIEPGIIMKARKPIKMRVCRR